MIGLHFVASVAIAACATAPAEIREHTYPPEFRYLDHQKISDAMLGFTRDLERIDEILRTTAVPSEVDRQDIITRLARMQGIAVSLDGGFHGNRPLIDARLDDFRRDVGLARQSVEADPPSYFLAGSVAGSCLHCHGARGPR